MYISKVEIDINNRQKIKDLSHLGAYHSWVEESFPNEFIDKSRTRKLWRIDKLGSKYFLIVVSSTKPDLNKLETYGISNSALTKEYDTFLKSLQVGQILKFKAVLNPTFSVSTGKLSGKRGKLYQCIGNDAQLNYLKERSSKNGFELMLDNYLITNKNQEILRKHDKSYFVTKVCYEGYLLIKDKEQFIKTLTLGIGPKKAYGCGLMTVI